MKTLNPVFVVVARLFQSLFVFLNRVLYNFLIKSPLLKVRLITIHLD